MRKNYISKLDAENDLLNFPKKKLKFNQKTKPKKRKSLNEPKSAIKKIIDGNKKASIWKSMSDEGLFFILTIVNTILFNDFGFSYRLATATQNKVTTGRLFKSNCMRFGSLSRIKLFQHALEEGGEVIENFKLLAEAISSIKESLKIYEVSDQQNVQD